MAEICEPLPYYPAEEVYDARDVPPVKALKLFGWSFATSTGTLKNRQFERIDALDRMPAANPAQKREKYIASAYYSLELATNLRPLQDVIEEYEQSDYPTPRRLLDEITTASLIDQALNQAYDTYADMSLDELNRLRENTKQFKPDNTGSLKALRTMSKTSEQYGWLSSHTTGQAAMLVRLCIAEENGIDWKKSEESSDKDPTDTVS